MIIGLDPRYVIQYFYFVDVQHTFFDDYYEFVPIVDGYGGVIPESPERLASYRPKVPAIIGTTRDEAALHFCKYSNFIQLLY